MRMKLRMWQYVSWASPLDFWYQFCCCCFLFLNSSWILLCDKSSQLFYLHEYMNTWISDISCVMVCTIHHQTQLAETALNLQCIFISKYLIKFYDTLSFHNAESFLKNYFSGEWLLCDSTVFLVTKRVIILEPLLKIAGKRLKETLYMNCYFKRETFLWNHHDLGERLECLTFAYSFQFVFKTESFPQNVFKHILANPNSNMHDLQISSDSKKYFW